VIAENQQFKVFSGGDCGATDQVVTIDDCSKNIKGHLKTCSVAESALNSEARLLLVNPEGANTCHQCFMSLPSRIAAYCFDAETYIYPKICDTCLNVNSL